MNLNLKTIAMGVCLAFGLVGGSASYASVIGPFPKENGEANEISAAITQLSNAGADTTGVVALGKLETDDSVANAGLAEGLNIETEDYGLGLDAVLSDFDLDGNELKGFDMALDAVAGYDLFAVLIKAGTQHIIYWDNMFDDMTTSLLGNKGVSHISYFGKASSNNNNPGQVPVPASMPLLLAGLGLTAYVARRRKQ